ncbi:MAG: hypothetical protein WC196_04860 [Bacilli bacterium]
MKKLVFLILFCLMAVTAFSTMTYGPIYYRDHISEVLSGGQRDPIRLAFNEIDGYLSGSNALSMIFFDPTTEPTETDEGLVYYDDASNSLKLYDGSTWTALATAAGNSLDLSYDAGSAITVDGDAITLTTGAAVNNSALAIVHGETTNDNDAFTITNAADSATAVSIQIDGTAGYDIQGTGDVWNVSTAGAITCVGVTTTGAVTVTAADVIFDDTYDLMWDTSEDTLVFKDNAVLGFGNTGTAPDVEITWDTDSLNVTAAAIDTPLEIGGTTYGFDVTYYFETAGTIDIDYDGDNMTFSDTIDLIMGTDGDWIIESDTAKTLEFIPATTDESSTFNIGANQAGADFKVFGATSGAYALWDASADQLVVVGGGQISLNDDVELLVGTGTTNAGDFKISGTSAPKLVIDVVSAGSGEIEIGNDADDVPMKWFGETTGDFVYFTGDDLQIEDISLCIAEGTQIQFGDPLGTGDITMSCTSNLLTIGQVAAGAGAVAYGVNDAGVDVTFYGDTALQKCWWDASGDEWFYGADAEGVDVTFYSTTTGDYMKWDEDGQTNAGALVFEDSKIMMMDDTAIIFGDGSDASIMYDETTDDNLEILCASGGTTLTTNDVLITTDGAAADQFKVDATGTVAGYAVVVETTDGGVQVNADGADNGDISIDAADDMTLTAAGDLTLAVTGSLKMGGALIANNRITTNVDADDRILTAAESGSTVVFTMTGGAATCTLPEATANNIGMWFILVDANPTAGRDLSVDPEGTGTINGDGAGEKITCENDRDGEAVYIFSTGADTWYAVLLGSSTAWTEE